MVKTTTFDANTPDEILKSHDEDWKQESAFYNLIKALREAGVVEINGVRFDLLEDDTWRLEGVGYPE